MPEFDAGVGGGELPIDMDVAAVAAVFPDARLLAHFLASGDAAIETLACECAQFRLGGVQPAPVFGRVDQLDLLRYPQGLAGLERLIERTQLVGVEIVTDEGDALRLSIAPVINELLYLTSPVQAGAAVGRPHAPPPG